MAKKPEAPDVPAAPGEAEFWSKGSKFRLGPHVLFRPFVPGVGNMGKFEDRPNLLSRSRDEDEHLLFRGYFRTSDPALIADLTERCNPASHKYLPAIRRNF